MTTARIVFFCYLCCLIGVGFYFSKRTKTVEGYLLGGRSLGPAVTALTMQATAMSGYMFMGGPSYAFSIGWFSLFYAVGDAGGSIVNISILGKKMRRLSEILGCLSPIEYLEKRYESSTIRVVGSAIALVFLSAYVIAQFIAAGKALSSLLGISYSVALIGGVTAILFYTVTGGYLAVAWNDFFQGIIMVTGMIGVLILALLKIGGLTSLNQKLAAIDPTYLSVWGKGLIYQNQWGVILGAILIYLVGYMGLPHVVVRHMSMKSSKTAKSALLYATFWNQLFVFTPYILGLIGIVMLPNLSDPEMVVPELAFMLFPGAIAAIILSAVMAAIITTADSLLMQTGSILSRDVYERFINPNASEKQLVLASRIMVFGTGIIGIAIALIQPPGVFTLVVFAFGVLANSFLVPYVAAVYWDKANNMGALGAMIGGGLTNFIWTVAKLEIITYMHPFFAGLLASIACLFIFNRFGNKPSQKIIDAVHKAQGKNSSNVSKGIQNSTCKMLAPEANAVSIFIASRPKKTFQIQQ
ncbi:sodium/proline symporter [Crassaminicella thermophila]|uniref:Sodium/proline symporter n=1 Tax=Crassaminicella thermophila TaxID=2599308 RepID=A0A5C0SF17_CRATE|nr:sodium/proline symporter [Crassaminicella thermophila]QEK12931.1 sodium/proline symporter [Crassaminicella thermophila]